MYIKKLKSLIAVALLLNYLFVIPNSKVNADENKRNQEKYNSNLEHTFSQDRKKYDNINRKIEEEIESNTDILDEDIEKYLNENGVYDREIEQIKDVGYMSGLDKEDIQIFSAYYSVKDNPEKADVPITDDEMEQLSSKEINELFGNIYYGQNKDISGKKEKSSKNGLLDKFLTVIGIKPINAYAAVLDDEDGSRETYLKKLMIIYSKKVNGVECYEVIYFSTWETMPKYRNVDVVSLYWANAKWQPELDYKTVVKQNWDYDSFYYEEVSKLKLGCKSGTDMKEFSVHNNPGELKESQYFISTNGIIAVLKLHEDKKEKDIWPPHGYDIVNYSNEELVIQLYLEKDKYRDTVIFYPYYEHCISYSEVESVGVSIISAIGGGINGSTIKANYILTNDFDLKVKTNWSGKNVDWKYTYKYK
ncbi:MAG: hypothetical protein IJA34_11605 [Lachnospiraceae bacterium]|nr:hypothetical protein [Lachnospiraceae bacterium]